MSANARNHQLILLNYPSGSGVILNMSLFSTNLFAVNCTLRSIDQSVLFWSFDLEIIIPLISKHRIIQVFYNLMPLHPFFNWLCADAHISSAMDRQILYWIIIRQCPPYLITLWAFPWIHNAFGELYPLFSQPCSVFELVVFMIEACGIWFHDTLTGWTYAFLNLCEPKSFHGSYSSGNSLGRFWHWNHVYLEQWMKGYALEKWESTLNFVFMPMDTM